MTPSEKVLVHTLYLRHNTHGELHFELDHPLRSKRAPTSSTAGSATARGSSVESSRDGDGDVNGGSVDVDSGNAKGDNGSNGNDAGVDLLSSTEAELYASLSVLLHAGRSKGGDAPHWVLHVDRRGLLPVSLRLLFYADVRSILMVFIGILKAA